MNMAVRIVIQWWPEVICAGTTDHWVTNASPFISSSTKTKAFTRMMKTVTTGMLAGRRDASLNGDQASHVLLIPDRTRSYISESRCLAP